MEKKIIVPVDFSEVSYNAYLYARGIARDLDCSLEVVHTYKVSYSRSNFASFMAELGTYNSISKALEKFVNTYPQEKGDVMTKLKVATKVVEDNAISYIIEQSRAEDVLMILMGTDGEHDTVEYFTGSVSSKVAQQAGCPVLLVPDYQTYQSFGRILYASNFEAAKPEMVKRMIDFANLFRASIHFIHVYEKGETGEFTKTEEEIFQQLFEDGDPAFSFNMASIKSASVQAGLNQYAEENKIDLIVLVNRQRSLFESVTGQSLTKKMALDIKYPLLVDHI